MIDLDHVFFAIRKETLNNQKHMKLNRDLFRLWLLSGYEDPRISTLTINSNKRLTNLRNMYGKGEI
jgi:hypothetical protein